MVWRWLTSRTFRQAMELHRHVASLFRSQQDLLVADGLEAVRDALDQLRECWRAGGDKDALRAAMRDLRAASDEWLVDPSKSMVRELAEMLLVALTVVLALQSFFLRPMAIPTGSMQPTLYGITLEDLREKRDVRIPGFLRRLFERCFLGRAYYHIVATAPGQLVRIDPPEPIVPHFRLLPFLTKQRFQVGDVTYTIWFPPRDLPIVSSANPDHLFLFYAGVKPHRSFQRGEDIVRLAVNTGDHVLVDRFTYNFRRPQRGEIVVFRTKGIPAIPQETHYIKRLVALGGEKVRIGNDRHLVIDGRRLDATTRHFDNVYNFFGRPQENRYSGHLNDYVARKEGGMVSGTLAPLFAREQTEFQVRRGYLMVMGDNTMNSSDGRAWGDFPQENVIGRYLAVYWPMGRRFGWGQD